MFFSSIQNQHKILNFPDLIPEVKFCEDKVFRSYETLKPNLQEAAQNFKRLDLGLRLYLM